MVDKSLGLPPRQSMSVATIRAGDVARYSFGVPPEPVTMVEDQHIPGPRRPLRTRIYGPSANKDLSVLVVFSA